MDKETIELLIEKYKDGLANSQEQEQLLNWYRELACQDAEYPDEELVVKLRMMARLNAETLGKASKTIALWPRIAVAASILFFLSFGAYFLLHKKAPSQQVSQLHDIAPAGNKAILTLANGKKIILNGAHIGTLAQQGNSIINKAADGEVVYKKAGNNETQNSELITYNQITIPRGGEYQEVVLSDGSKVWINSASSLRYPTAFNGNDRKVELVGEAYFEVAHNPKKPFSVASNGQTVEVLGTHFNINAYDDEPAIKTTLLNGRVKVTAVANNEMRFLQPGQQAALSTGTFTINQVETEEAIAWKNGKFMFESDNIQYIMRAISRWYDVDVEYNGAIPDDAFDGGISRFKNVSELLNILELTGKVHFKIEGRKIIVSK